MRPTLAAALVAAAALLPQSSPRAAPSDYPTEALADYVFACMATNGQTPEALRRCSCSIDQIAEQVSYEDYQKAETVLRMQRALGADDRVAPFRQAPWAQAMVDKVRSAQVAAEAECF